MVSNLLTYALTVTLHSVSELDFTQIQHKCEASTRDYPLFRPARVIHARIFVIYIVDYS